jgi:hypothetical protein
MIQERDLRERHSGICFPLYDFQKRHAKNQFGPLVFRRDAQFKFSYSVQCKFEGNNPLQFYGPAQYKRRCNFHTVDKSHFWIKTSDTAEGGGLRPAMTSTYETVSAEGYAVRTATVKLTQAFASKRRIVPLAALLSRTPIWPFVSVDVSTQCPLLALYELFFQPAAVLYSSPLSRSVVLLLIVTLRPD